MIIVVDAYNVLKQIIRGTLVTENARTTFITQLGMYSKKKGHDLVVVFDAGPYERPFKELVKGVKVVYSGIHESADQWIKKYIEQHKSYDILLISTDRELNNYAARYAVQSLDSLDFYAMVKQTLHQQGCQTKQSPIVKIAHDSSQEIDALMGSTRVVSKAEDALLTKERNSSGNKLSKKERNLINKIKKL